MTSSAASIDSRGPDARQLEAMARFLAERRTFGVAWLDRDLVIRQTFGHFMDAMPVGARLETALPVFLGFEGDIKRLVSEPERSVVIPNVLLQNTDSLQERLNFAIFWSPREGSYYLLVARAISRVDLEYRLAAEVRARAIAEAEVAAQSRLVKRANLELAAANADLQEFASVISHDLRAPLRALRFGSADALAALEAGQVDVAREALQRSLHQGRRMNAMLSGLLDYARAGRKTDGLEVLDTHGLAREIARTATHGSEHQVTVTGDWPTIETLAEPLDIVLRNLADNASKHHDLAAGMIMLDCKVDGDDLVISVSDDGPGIDPAWHEAIFLPFRQIADSEQGPDGAGIGLALVRKTVERFGGRIEVISEPAKRRGTTFRVVWPRSLKT